MLHHSSKLRLIDETEIRCYVALRDRDRCRIMTDKIIDRRHFTAGVGTGLIAAVAGCMDSGESSNETAGDESGEPSDGSTESSDFGTGGNESDDGGLGNESDGGLGNESTDADANSSNESTDDTTEAESDNESEVAF